MYRLLKKHFFSPFKLFFFRVKSNRVLHFSNGWTRTKCEEVFFSLCDLLLFLSVFLFLPIKTKKGY